MSVSTTAELRLEDGKSVEEWHRSDVIGLFQQLGVIPPLEELVEEANSKQE